jgi:hypothetical protein
LTEKKFKDCVRPGVEDVRANPRTDSNELIKLDLPTFDRPRNATSGCESFGQSSSLKALFMNSALVTFIDTQMDTQTMRACATEFSAFC